jgi:hypothetical protein
MATRFETEMWTTNCIIDFRGMPSTLIIILIVHQQHAFQKKIIVKEATLDLGRNKRSSAWRIYLVVPVLSSNYNTVLADVVSLVANNKDFARRNASERLVLIGIAKGNNCTSLANIHNQYRYRELTSRNLRRLRRTQSLRRSMHKLRTLAVTRHHNLRVRALRRRLVDQVEQRRSARRITTRKESQHTRRVVHALDRKTARAAQRAGKCVEERGALGAGFAHVAWRRGAACEEHGYWAAGCAIGQLVEGVAVVLALAQGGIGGGGELCGVFVDGEGRVDEVGYGEGDIVVCGGGGRKGGRCEEEGNEGLDGLHFEDRRAALEECSE